MRYLFITVTLLINLVGCSTSHRNGKEETEFLIESEDIIDSTKVIATLKRLDYSRYTEGNLVDKRSEKNIDPNDSVYQKYPWAVSDPSPSESPYELLLNNTWRPVLSVTGADGLSTLVNAGNVQLPYTTLKLSFRLPPTCDADIAASAVKAALEADTPPLANVEFDADSSMAGWNAPPVADWLEASMQKASDAFFGKPSMYMGTGGTIPFMGMLGEKFPEAQFLVTGLLGPNSNAHGPNEFLHIETGKRLTSCVAQVLEDHFTRQDGLSD